MLAAKVEHKDPAAPQVQTLTHMQNQIWILQEMVFILLKTQAVLLITTITIGRNMHHC
jgi:hypothetical protein